MFMVDLNVSNVSIVEPLVKREQGFIIDVCHEMHMLLCSKLLVYLS